MSEKLVLIDGNSIAYRAFYGLPLLNNDKGIFTNAIYGFTMMLMRILEEEKPTHILVAFDAGKTTFRHAEYKEYKGGRQKTPPELSEQFPYIRQLLDVFGITRYELENYEADDIVGTFCKRAEEKQMDVTVFTGDRDYLQLVSEHVTVNITRKGVTEVDVYTPEFLLEKYSVTPEQFIDLKGLMGDPSDNIPGVPGVGEKTAIKLLKQFSTIKGIYEHIDEVSGAKLKEKLVENEELAHLSKKLVTIFNEVPMDIELNDLSLQPLNYDEIAVFFKELGFNTLLQKLPNAEELESEVEAVKMEDIQFEHVTSFTKEQLNVNSSIFLEFDGENYLTSNLLGLSISNENGNYFMTGENVLQDEQLRVFLQNESIKKRTYDAKKVMAYFLHNGIEVEGIDFDIALAVYVVNPGESSKELSELASYYNVMALQSDEEVYGKGAKWKIPSIEVLAEHTVRKAIVIQVLQEKLEIELEENDQLELLDELELPLSRVLAKMEVQGVSVSKETLTDMGSEIAGRLSLLEKEIHALAGEAFNVNSPKQLGVILFEKLGLTAVKKTKTGYSTSVDVLEKLIGEHEIISKIMTYRQLGKLHSTYIEGLLKVIHEDGKVHTRFQQVLTQTGRLSSVDPNLQNIPIRLEEGKKIRKAFVSSEKDWVIFAADYSQIELRVLAHISKDENMIDAFHHDFDIHTKTAMDVFHVGKDAVDSNMRRQAKAVNFGIVYGISDFGLSQNLGITRKQAAEFIDKYLASYPGVKEYMDNVIQEAKLSGYVSTIFQRRRYIPDIHSKNFNLRSFAERTAMNTPIQGSAADIIKKAMIDMDEAIKIKGLRARMVLQVHDELIFECPKDELEILEKLVPEIMENAVALNVPLKVDSSSGTTWFDAK